MPWQTEARPGCLAWAPPAGQTDGQTAALFPRRSRDPVSMAPQSGSLSRLNLALFRISPRLELVTLLLSTGATCVCFSSLPFSLFLLTGLLTGLLPFPPCACPAGQPGSVLVFTLPSPLSASFPSSGMRLLSAGGRVGAVYHGGQREGHVDKEGCHQTLQLPIKCTAEQGQRDCKGTGRLGEMGADRREALQRARG